MRITPNMNGSSRESLVEGRLEILRTAQAFRDALRAVWPNGRDYQLSPDPEARSEDSADWCKVETAVRNFEDVMEQEAIAIQDGEVSHA